MIVLGRRRVDENWWEGSAVDALGHLTAQAGLFPVNFVCQLSLPSSSASCREPVQAVVIQVGLVLTSKLPLCVDDGPWFPRTSKRNFRKKSR